MQQPLPCEEAYKWSVKLFSTKEAVYLHYFGTQWSAHSLMKKMNVYLRMHLDPGGTYVPMYKIFIYNTFSI